MCSGIRVIYKTVKDTNHAEGIHAIYCDIANILMDSNQWIMLDMLHAHPCALSHDVFFCWDSQSVSRSPHVYIWKRSFYKEAQKAPKIYTTRTFFVFSAIWYDSTPSKLRLPLLEPKLQCVNVAIKHDHVWGEKWEEEFVLTHMGAGLCACFRESSAGCSSWSFCHILQTYTE